MVDSIMDFFWTAAFGGWFPVMVVAYFIILGLLLWGLIRSFRR